VDYQAWRDLLANSGFAYLWTERATVQVAAFQRELGREPAAAGLVKRYGEIDLQGTDARPEDR
jgi:hypothetical protein